MNDQEYALRIQALLQQTDVLVKKHDTLARATGENFNLFEILGSQADETRTHSAILAELLDPNGSHGQGATFLRSFWRLLEIPIDRIESTLVLREFHINEDSRIDILIESDLSCVVIENKIYASDQPKQLKRYFDAVKNRKNPKVFYLTLHGDKPSDQALDDLDEESVSCISYDEDILDWLDDCIKEVARIPQIREILVHYQALIRKLTHKSTEGVLMDLKQLLLTKQGDTDNLVLIPRLFEAMTELSNDRERTFWTNLQSQLSKVSGNHWQLERDAQSPYSDVPPLLTSSETSSSNRVSNYYGWTFDINAEHGLSCDKIAGVEICLRVEKRDNQLVYGLVAVAVNSTDRTIYTKNSDERFYSNWLKWMNEMEQTWENNTWWLAVKAPKHPLNFEKRPWLPSETVRTLDKEDAVKHLVCQIREMLIHVTNV